MLVSIEEDMAQMEACCPKRAALGFGQVGLRVLEVETRHDSQGDMLSEGTRLKRKLSQVEGQVDDS